MSYGEKYIIKTTNKLNEYYEISFAFKDFSGMSTELLTTDKFLTLRSTNGDENRLEPILGLEALIEVDVQESSSLTIADLVATEDSQIKVTVTRIDLATGDETIPFQGFVVVEDNHQPFLDPPFTLQIRALDGLGLLKGVDLVDTNGLLFSGSQTVIQWIGQILFKTNQDVPVRVYFNFFPNSFSELGALAEFTLNSITFSQGDKFNATPNDPSIDINAGAADDCYTALEKIIRNLRCRLFFEDGRFMIVNLKEYTNPTYSFYEYAFGTEVGGIIPMNPSAVGNKTYNVSVGKNEIIFPCEADQILYLKLATKYVKLTYNYDQSLNKICNQDLKEGDPNATFDGTISSSIQDPTIQPPVTFQTKGFDWYCWTKQGGTITAGSGGNYQPFPATSAPGSIYIRSVLDSLDYEAYRYGVITSQSAVGFIRSSTFLLDIGDALEVTLDWRLRTAGTAGVRAIFFILMAGVDGTFWALGYPGSALFPQWFQCDSNYYGLLSPGVTPFINYASGGALASNEWNTFDIRYSATGQLLKAPVSGDCFLVLAGANDGTETWFKNISVTITPYFQGSYRPLKGDYNFSSSDLNIKQSEKDDIEISDSPKRYFKGALLNPDGKTLIPPDWHRRGVDEHLRFTQCMERIMFNLLGRMVYKIEGDFKGVLYRDNEDYGTLRPIGYLQSYFFTDSDFPSKRFILTSFEIDFYQGQGRRVFVEIQNDANDSGWNPPDNYKFDYIFQ